ncbi:uncharacterized protein LOC135075559 [Ostrinia nubilalis]|uniref:uncharacterized protein LOC135075559 n=1 Tax=Ostrinia nubilalis TaxID=29057 RepID=UPI003082627E
MPIIILPTINQHQSISILKTIYQNEKNNQSSQPAKPESTNSTDYNDEFEDVEVLNQSSSRDSPEPKINKNEFEEVNDLLRATTKNATAVNTSTVQAQTETTTNVPEDKTTIPSNTTETPDIGYPTAVYNNEFVTSVELTTTESDKGSDLPPVDDNRWQNFTNVVSNATQVNGSLHTSTTQHWGPYPAAIYDNSAVNNLELTTPVYQNDTFLPPVGDERWKNFSSDTFYDNSGQFKPLAGLYYDGFLHKPLKKVGFVPRPNYIF